MNRDFRLFHEITKKESRVLDNDRLICKIFNLKEEHQGNFLSRVRSSIVNTIVPDSRPELTFKKYFYLPLKEEKHEYKRDLIRLKLWTFQIFNEVKDMKYQFESSDLYFFFAATFLYALKEGEVDEILRTNAFDVKMLKEMIFPDEILKIESISHDELKEKVLKLLSRLHE